MIPQKKVCIAQLHSTSSCTKAFIFFRPTAIFHITTKFTRTHHANHLHILSTKCFSSMDKGRDKGIRSSLQSPSLQWLSKQWSTSFQKYPSLQKLHHSRSDITPEATSIQKQHHARSNIIPEATLLQKQNLSNSPPSFQQFHHFFDHCHSSRSQHSSGQCHCRVPHQRGDDNHTAVPLHFSGPHQYCGFVDAVTPNTPAVLVTMVDTVNMVSETPSHKLCPSLYHTSDPHAAVGSTSNITSQWSPSSQKRSPHQHIFHDRQANSTSKRTKQNRAATQTLCPMNIHKHHPCKIAKVILPRLQDCEYIPAPPLPTSLLSYTHHVST